MGGLLGEMGGGGGGGGGGLKENVFRSYAVIFKRIFQFIGVIKTF